MINFSLVIHNHQPVGNFDGVIREAFEKSYKPFADALYGFPDIRFCMHFSGILYDWLEKNERGYLKKLGEMVSRGQLEILSGGYYEPILSVIPEKDRIAQIKKMNSYIERTFGTRPEGIWLAERVWEPDLPQTIYDCGLKYALLDDAHFMSVGLKEEELNGPFITEYNSKTIHVFAINHNLRYLIPFKEPHKTIEYLSGFEKGVLIMADDGEKFGLWPKTHKLVYGEKWLENFLHLLRKNSGGIKTEKLSDSLKKAPAKNVIYLPTASYHELSQWALPAEMSGKLQAVWKNAEPGLKNFLKGGFFRNFFSKYPESNFMHKKMLYASEKANRFNDSRALDFIYKAQCNCGYWHGVFGGVYLPHIRMAVYENLLKAQDIIFRNYSKGKFLLEEKDLDCDGREELLAENEKACFVFSPKKGGALAEWSVKDPGINFNSIVNRRREAYHGTASSDIGGSAGGGSSGELIYDWHSRNGLLDHFLHPDTTLEKFYRSSYGEQGDFVLGEYELEKFSDRGGARIKMSRDGQLWQDGKTLPLRVEKEILLSGGAKWEARYEIKNPGPAAAKIFFGAELVFAFSNKSVADMSAAENVTECVFKDPARGKIKLKFDRKTGLWIFPIETISNSECGVEKTYQGSVIMPVLKAEIKSGESLRFSIEAEYSHG
ncbi:MAG: 4-alpha-glucanotransferase [Elusimicrobia bacterium CG08_land_8_20_14_0_20_51_18]|nr:MAG: 4-alpha-glucanotransferase [Elusimicrobia bacterium CG08_land_8_20_14_0_20_51_18]